MEEEIAKEAVISKPEEKKVEFDNDMEAYFNANKHRVTKAKEPVREKPSIKHASTHLEPTASDLFVVSDSWPALPNQNRMEKQSRGVTKKVDLNPKAHEFIPSPMENPTSMSQVQGTGWDSHLKP